MELQSSPAKVLTDLLLSHRGLKSKFFINFDSIVQKIKSYWFAFFYRFKIKKATHIKDDKNVPLKIQVSI